LLQLTAGNILVSEQWYSGRQMTPFKWRSASEGMFGPLTQSLSSLKTCQFCQQSNIIKVSTHTLTDSPQCCPVQFLNLSQCNNTAPLVTMLCAHRTSPVTNCSTCTETSIALLRTTWTTASVSQWKSHCWMPLSSNQCAPIKNTFG
jgi:hypothetical protein